MYETIRFVYGLLGGFMYFGSFPIGLYLLWHEVWGPAIVSFLVLFGLGAWLLTGINDEDKHYGAACTTMIGVTSILVSGFLIYMKMYWSAFFALIGIFIFFTVLHAFSKTSKDFGSVVASDRSK